MGKTSENLQAAFAGESMANRRYTAFGRKADEEKFAQVAKLFRGAAAAETVHALNHFRAMDGVKTTEENLKVAIGNEHYEVVTMYPDFIQAAKEEGAPAKRALNSFSDAWEVEKVHEALYTQALATLQEPQGELFDYYVCPVCGFTIAKAPPDKCPVCSTPGRRFERIS